MTVQARDCSVNGYMITPEFKTDIPKGKSTNSNLTLPYFSLAIADITVIREIDFALRVTEARTYNPLFVTDIIPVKTSAFKTEDEPAEEDIAGQTVYDKDDIKIVLRGVSSDRAYSDGAEMVVCIFNLIRENTKTRRFLPLAFTTIMQGLLSALCVSALTRPVA